MSMMHSGTPYTIPEWGGVWMSIMYIGTPYTIPEWGGVWMSISGHPILYLSGAESR